MELSGCSGRIPINSGAVDVLRAWRRRQSAGRVAWGPAWTESGQVSTRVDSAPLRPGWISTSFGALTIQAALATDPLLRSAPWDGHGAPGQPIQRIHRGHDIEVAGATADAADSAIAAYIPRRKRWAKESDHD